MSTNEATRFQPAGLVSIRPILSSIWTEGCLLAGAICIVWLCIAGQIVREGDFRTSEGFRDSRNLADAAVQNIDGMITHIDRTLRSLRMAIAAEPGQFDLDKWIAGTGIQSSELDITLIDRNGMLRPNRRNEPPVAIDVSDRSYFQNALTSGSDELFIGEPMLRRNVERWGVPFSHKLLSADGSFAGVAVAWADPAWLTRLASKLDIGNGVLIALGTDGVIRARAPAAPSGIATLPASSDLMKNAAIADRGSFRSPSMLDGKSRFVSYRRLQGYPLIVSVGLDPDVVFFEYHKDRFNYIVVGGILTLVILGVGGALIKQSRTLRRSRQLLADAVDNIAQGLVVIDENRRIPLVNRQAIDLLGLSPEQLSKCPSFDALTRERIASAQFGENAGYQGRTFTAADLDPFILQTGSIERTLPDGRVVSVQTKLLANGGAVRTFMDISDRKQAEQHVRHLAHHDALTGLANRALLDDRLTQAFSRARRDGTSLAVLALDLNHFKAVNDSFGHAIGDELLQAVSNRLLGTLRATDTLARIGGDEFFILQTGVRQPVSAGVLGRRLIELFAKPFDLGEHSISVGVSVGIAVYPSDGDEPKVLLQKADLALYRAKAEHQAAPCFFRAEMQHHVRRQQELKDDLRRAIGTDQLYLNYQPIFAAATGLINGFEALLRWEHPTRGNIPPASFIPLAEESGLILAIGKWVLEQACFAAAAWPEPKLIAINVSAAQLRERGLPVQVADVLRRSGLPARLLELEVTESLLIDDSGKVSEVLCELQEMGVQIACDDFGTGYSSFKYLQSFTFNRVKIDKSFVQELQANSKAFRIVQAILAIANSLGLKVTAEGVETEEQLALLQDQRCSEVQGFLLGRPMSGDAIQRCLIDNAAKATACLTVA